jgi:anti-sigma B factor antagonist
MELTTSKEGSIFTIGINGDLDASSSIDLDNCIADALKMGETKLMVDCEQLHYISSAGLGVFMSYIQDFNNNNIQLVLFNMSEKVKSVFNILGLDALLTIVNSKEDALSIIK